MKPCNSTCGFCTVLYGTAHMWFQTKTINFFQLKTSLKEPLFLNSLQAVFSPQLRRHFMTSQNMQNIPKIILSGQHVLKSTEKMKILFDMYATKQRKLHLLYSLTTCPHSSIHELLNKFSWILMSQHYNKCFNIFQFWYKWYNRQCVMT